VAEEAHGERGATQVVALLDTRMDEVYLCLRARGRPVASAPGAVLGKPEDV
jgi:hypothetical protein